MLKDGFNSYFQQRKGSKLVLEAEGVIKHLTHLEEYILTRKKAGFDIAIRFIEELAKAFSGNTDTKINTTVKYDGSPAIIAGYNPENNRFFVSTKSVANVTPKINYTPEDVDVNHGVAPDLANKLKLALQYLPSVIKKNIYQGDYMFSRDDLKVISHAGENLVTFHPNTIVYAVPVQSELGQKIVHSKIGVVFHTRLTGDSLKNLKQSFGVNENEFNRSPEVWIEDARFKDVSGTATLTKQETEFVQDTIESVKQQSNDVKWDHLDKDFYLEANTFINSLIQINRFIDDPVKEYDIFIDWLNRRSNKAVEKLKSERGKEKNRNAFKEKLKHYSEHKHDIISVFSLTKKLESLKLIFVKKYDQSLQTKQFLVQDDGSLTVTNNEGYVAVDHEGNMVKLINRLDFSRANFLGSKNRK